MKYHFFVTLQHHSIAIFAECSYYCKEKQKKEGKRERERERERETKRKKSNGKILRKKMFLLVNKEEVNFPIVVHSLLSLFFPSFLN